jgi:acetate kinase
MLVLVLNSGSSSLKFRLCKIGGDDCTLVHTVLGGLIEPIGGSAVFRLTSTNMPVVRHERQITDHTHAVGWLFDWLQSPEAGAAGAGLLSQIDAIGHRVGHGGARFQQAVRIDTDVLAEIERLCELALLHNPASLAVIRGAQALFGSAMPMVAVFDTAFHHTLPARAALYALPPSVATAHHIRRYGFHGIAHASLADGYARATGQPVTDTRLITLHLGNGCSATALKYGQSVDTSMGFTPLEGLMMGTRAGDLDPAIVSYLARHAPMSLDAVERLLNAESGLLGVSGLSQDMRTLQTAVEQRQDARVALAIEMFCYRVRKYIGAYLAVLGGADAVVFGGGIGEHAPAIRERICAGMEWCGLRLDPERNAATVDLAAGQAARISDDAAKLAAYVVAVDEETWIARETVQCVHAAHEIRREHGNTTRSDA